MNNPAFDFLRKHKDVSEETENLVIKQVRNRVSPNDLLICFENGISGQYGKLYSADPQTLIGWVNKYLELKNSPTNYLDAPLLDINLSETESFDWCKETNKSYHAFLKGISHEFFHHCVYDNLLLEGKIPVNAYQKYYKMPEDADPEKTIWWNEIINEIKKAKRKVIRDVFEKFKSYGYNDIFTLRKTE